MNLIFTCTPSAIIITGRLSIYIYFYFKCSLTLQTLSTSIYEICSSKILSFNFLYNCGYIYYFLQQSESISALGVIFKKKREGLEDFASLRIMGFVILNVIISGSCHRALTKCLITNLLFFYLK